jgi:uncharacterized membrane protein YfcA
LFIIGFTGSWSSWQQHQRECIDWRKAGWISLGIVLAAVLGGASAAWIPGNWLKAGFTAFAMYVGLQMFFGWQPRLKVSFTPQTATSAGLITGLLSSWVGIGGGSITVPFLASTGEAIPRAIGTSTAVGVVISVFASLGYAFSAWKLNINDPLRWGFVHLPSAISAIPTSFLGSYIGIQIAKHINALMLKRLFSLLLIGSAVKIGGSLTP